MVCYGLDGGLGGVNTMIVWLDGLDVDLFLLNEILDGLRELVLHDVQAWRQVPVAQIRINILKILDHILVFATLHQSH